jgi:hypothetical protein
VRIVQIQDATASIASDIRNVYIDFSAMDVSVVKVRQGLRPRPRIGRPPGASAAAADRSRLPQEGVVAVNAPVLHLMEFGQGATARREAYQRLREAPMTGQLRPGQPISIRYLGLRKKCLEGDCIWNCS